LGDEIAGNLGPNLGVGGAVQGADPFLINGNVLERHRHHLDFRRRRRRRRPGLVAASHAEEQRHHRKKPPALGDSRPTLIQ